MYTLCTICLVPGVILTVGAGSAPHTLTHSCSQHAITHPLLSCFLLRLCVRCWHWHWCGVVWCLSGSNYLVPFGPLSAARMRGRASVSVPEVDCSRSRHSRRGLENCAVAASRACLPIQLSQLSVGTHFHTGMCFFLWAVYQCSVTHLFF